MEAINPIHTMRYCAQIGIQLFVYGDPPERVDCTLGPRFEIDPNSMLPYHPAKGICHLHDLSEGGRNWIGQWMKCKALENPVD